MTEHPELDLSAYLDDALAPSERAAVAAHVEGCAGCRARLAELRATSRLIAALPAPRPRRSLVPRLDRAPAWLRPARLLGAIGSGLFVFVFIASAVINSGSSLGGGTTTAERLAEKGQFGAAANALASDAAAQKALGVATPAPAAAPAAPATASGPTTFDATRSTAASPSAVVRGDAASTTGPAIERTRSQPVFGPPPVVFLGLALLCALGAILAHRRLRRT